MTKELTEIQRKKRLEAYRRQGKLDDWCTTFQDTMNDFAVSDSPFGGCGNLSFCEFCRPELNEENICANAFRRQAKTAHKTIDFAKVDKIPTLIKTCFLGAKNDTGTRK